MLDKLDTYLAEVQLRSNEAMSDAELALDVSYSIEWSAADVEKLLRIIKRLRQAIDPPGDGLRAELDRMASEP